jgi:hypothetical protein
MRKMAALAVIALAGVLMGCAQLIPGAEKGVDLVVFSADAASVVAKVGDPLSLVEAEVAAGLMAKVNLLEKVKGAYLSGNVTVGDLMFKSQQAAAAVEGRLARATVVYESVTKGADVVMVRAIASIEMSGADFEMLEDYVE